MDRSGGRKISNFPSLTEVPAGSYFEFISSGVNYKISYADLVAGLGVTGSIEQIGAETGVPVLTQAGSVNYIRNIEATNGVFAEVSPENGLTLKHGFSFNSAGAALCANPSASTPVLRSIIGSDGLNISASGDLITIALSGTPATTKTVIVNSLSDLPDAVAGVISLDGSTEYLIRNDLDFGETRLAVSAGDVVVSAADPTIIEVTYTGTGDFITVSNCNFRAIGVSLLAPSGQLFNVSNVAKDKDLLLDGCTLIADRIITLSGNRSAALLTCKARFTGAHGVAFTGNCGAFIQAIGSMYPTSGTGSSYLFGSAVLDSFDLQQCGIVPLTGTKFISASGDSNITYQASIKDCNYFAFGGTLFDGFSPYATKKWNLFSNTGIVDTFTSSIVSMHGNATTSPTTSLGVAVKAGGTWVAGTNYKATNATTGRITVSNGQPQVLQLTGQFSVQPSAGGSQKLTVYIAKNGAVISEAKASVYASPGASTSGSVFWTSDAVDGDYFELWVANDSTTNTTVMTDGILRVIR